MIAVIDRTQVIPFLRIYEPDASASFLNQTMTVDNKWVCAIEHVQNDHSAFVLVKKHRGEIADTVRQTVILNGD